MTLTVLAYIVDAGIIATYGRMVWVRNPYPFHAANALGGPVLLAVEVGTHAWPVMPITFFFTALGLVGVLKARKQ
jgi:hypothetical protein